MENLSERADQWLEQTFPGASTTIFRDLAMNLRKILGESPLDPQDRLMNVVAVAKAVEMESLRTWAEAQLAEAGVATELIQEARQTAGMMGMLNTYYKFKTYLAPEAKDLYQRAGLRMQALMKPVSGKEKFEMMSLSVSVVNGCPSCVASHERALVQLGVDPEKIHDLARLAAVIKGLSSFQV